MNKNKVQFQKGISLRGFYGRFGTEDQCREYLFSSRWPDGFECIECGWRHFCEIKSRKVYQCTHCHHQMSYLIESILENTLSQNPLKLTAKKALEKLSPLKVVKLNLAGKIIYKTTPPQKEQLGVLTAMGLKKFERILAYKS